MGQLAPGRRKIVFLADIHYVGIAGSTPRGARVKVGHYLHTNVCKMGVVHRKNVPRKYPTFLRALCEKGYYIIHSSNMCASDRHMQTHAESQETYLLLCYDQF